MERSEQFPSAFQNGRQASSRGKGRPLASIPQGRARTRAVSSVRTEMSEKKGWSPSLGSPSSLRGVPRQGRAGTRTAVASPSQQPLLRLWLGRVSWRKFVSHSVPASLPVKRRLILIVPTCSGCLMINVYTLGGSICAWNLVSAPQHCPEFQNSGPYAEGA